MSHRGGKLPSCPFSYCSASNALPEACHPTSSPFPSGILHGMAYPSPTRRPQWQERWEELKPAPFRNFVEVLPGLYQVRTRGSKAYLIVEDEITLVDTGSPGSGARILQAVEELGRSPEDIKHIVITHYHIDHVGGLAELQEWVPGKTGVHLAEAPHVTSDRPLPNPFQHPWLARICEPYLLRNDPGAARVDVVLDDGEVCFVGELEQPVSGDGGQRRTRRVVDGRIGDVQAGPVRFEGGGELLDIGT